MNDLKYRALINGLSALLVVFFVFFAEFGFFAWIFTGAVVAIALVSLHEFYGFIRKKRHNPAEIIALIGSLLYLFSLLIRIKAPQPLWQILPFIILVMMVFAFFVYFALIQKEPIINIATTLLGVIYVTIPLGLAIEIVFFHKIGGAQDPHFEGSFFLAFVLAVTKAGDVGGYFIGRYFGKHKLALRISPNKTLEGAIAVLVASTLMSLFVCWIGKQAGAFQAFSYGAALILGIVIGIFGQLGDLAESLLKRDAKVKDSSRLPGVGGVLDMVDSLIFTLPVVYIFLKFYPNILGIL